MSGDRPTVSVVLPTLNAETWMPGLLAGLDRQKPYPPDEIIIMDSLSTDDTAAIASAHPNVRVVEETNFSHGGTRNAGIQLANGEIVVLMTQDAEPADENWLANLIAPLADESVGAVYSRQIPRDDAKPPERFFLHDRFPDGHRIERMFSGKGVPTYPDTFFSNVSSAARKETWLAHPFDETVLMSEDQHFTRDVLMAGKKIVYEPASVALHSHNYTLRQTFKRYFDSVVAFHQLSDDHGAGESARLGQVTLVRELKYHWNNYPLWLPYFVLYMVFKAMGVIAGHMHGALPKSLCAKFSMNPGWWIKK